MSHFIALLSIARKLKKELKLPHRKYHDINHIFFMWKNFKTYKHYVTLTPMEDIAIRLAIWFHDIRYDTGVNYKNNETFSEEISHYEIAMARRWLTGESHNVENVCDVMNLVNSMISNTANHTNFDETWRDTALGLFLDLDLLSLADMPNMFANNANIISEFKNVDPKVFWSARAKFLGELLTNRFGYFEFYTAQINKEHGEAAETGIMLLLQHAIYTAKQLDLATE